MTDNTWDLVEKDLQNFFCYAQRNWVPFGEIPGDLMEYLQPSTSALKSMVAGSFNTHTHPLKQMHISQIHSTEFILLQE